MVLSGLHRTSAAAAVSFHLFRAFYNQALHCDYDSGNRVSPTHHKLSMNHNFTLTFSITDVFVMRVQWNET